jgi:hypothetical protein
VQDDQRNADAAGVAVARAAVHVVLDEKKNDLKDAVREHAREQKDDNAEQAAIADLLRREDTAYRWSGRAHDDANFVAQQRIAHAAVQAMSAEAKDITLPQEQRNAASHVKGLEKLTEAKLEEIVHEIDTADTQKTQEAKTVHRDEALLARDMQEGKPLDTEVRQDMMGLDNPTLTAAQKDGLLHR